MSLPGRTIARLLGAVLAGAVGSAGAVSGLAPWLSWAFLGGALVGALSALERITTGASVRAARAFIAGAMVGVPAGGLALVASSALLPILSPASPALAPVAVSVAGFGFVGLVAGAAPGFLAFSGALSRGGAVGGLLGGIGGGALATLVPGAAGPLVAATCIGLAYVFWRRSHAAAKLVPLGEHPGMAGPMGITLRDHRITVGSGPECDLRLNDPVIERLRPMVIGLRDGSYWVEDPMGRAGMLKVNGESTHEHRLAHGDVIEIGHTRYRFEELGPQHA